MAAMSTPSEKSDLSAAKWRQFYRSLSRVCELAWPGMTGHQLTIEARAGKGTGRRILQVKGPLTSSTSDTFKEQVLVETAPAPVVMLDMSGVEDVDSNGIGTLTLVHMSFQRQSRRLAVVGLTPKVR